MGVCCSSCTHESSTPLLAENEREAVAELLRYLDSRGDQDDESEQQDLFSDGPLNALSTLVYSDNIDLQRSAALAFAEITEKYVKPVSRQALEPILLLLQLPDPEIQRAAGAALGNLAVNNENKRLVVEMGGLDPLIRQMMSPNVEVQCNAVGCMTNLATHEANKRVIAKSGALQPLTKLAKSPDTRVQRNATGALLNMTHSDENRHELVNAGAIPVLVSLLSSADPDVQYYCTTALSNIAVDLDNRKKLAQTEPRLVQHLVSLMGWASGASSRVKCQAALALRNLASDVNYQLEIVRAGGLYPLLELLRSDKENLVLAAVACIRNISIHPLNESAIVEAGFLQPLVSLLDSSTVESIVNGTAVSSNMNSNNNKGYQASGEGNKSNTSPSSDQSTDSYNANGTINKPMNNEANRAVAIEIECHAISTLRNLAASSERTKLEIVEAGAVTKFIRLLNESPPAVQSEITACLAVLALGDELKSKILDLGLVSVLVPFIMNSDNVEVQGNSAAALGNLSSKVDDYQPFIDCWTTPAGGIHAFLSMFLASSEPTFEHIAVWMILQLLESDNAELINHIRDSRDISTSIEKLAQREIVETPKTEDQAYASQMAVPALAKRVAKLLQN